MQYSGERQDELCSQSKAGQGAASEEEKVSKLWSVRVPAHQPRAVHGTRDPAVAGILSVGVRDVPPQVVPSQRWPPGYEAPPQELARITIADVRLLFHHR